jgi:hypothetical protein
VDGGFAAYEDGFTALELARKHYREAGLVCASWMHEFANVVSISDDR